MCITTPTTPDRPEASDRAAGLGRKLVRSTTAWTRRRVAFETEPLLRTRETVARDTPLNSASSSIVLTIPNPLHGTSGSALNVPIQHPLVKSDSAVNDVS